LDPITAERLKPNDSQRIQRALEIIELSGSTMSSLLTGDSGNASAAAPYTLLPLALEPSNRSVLHTRIAQRFDQMLDGDALLNEVAALRACGDLHPGLPSMRCVGYRQAWEYLDGLIDRNTLREKGIAATRQLAKRQLTWLRGMDERIVIDCLAEDAAQQALALVQQALQDHPLGRLEGA
jgi:tRNA dimethylallyltransferase